MPATISGDYVLSMAERIERNSVEFYNLAAERAPLPARVVMLELAAAEAAHERQFQEVRAMLSGGEVAEFEPDRDVEEYLRELLDGKFFEATADPASYFTGKETYREILLTAIRLEKETITFYEGVKLVAGDKDGRATVDLIIRAEMGHITTLAAQLSAFDSGRPI